MKEAKIPTLMLSTYIYGNGEVVWQVMHGGSPLTRPLSDKSAAIEAYKHYAKLDRLPASNSIPVWFGEEGKMGEIKTNPRRKAAKRKRNPSTITIAGHEYSVTVHPGNKYGTQYHLAGARGALYGTLRNVKNPSMMFLVNGNGRPVPSYLKNVWLTDKNGVLEVY